MIVNQNEREQEIEAMASMIFTDGINRQEDGRERAAWAWQAARSFYDASGGEETASGKVLENVKVAYALMGDLEANFRDSSTDDDAGILLLMADIRNALTHCIPPSDGILRP